MPASPRTNEYPFSTGYIVDEEGVVDAVSVPAKFCAGEAKVVEVGEVGLDVLLDGSEGG